MTATLRRWKLLKDGLAHRDGCNVKVTAAGCWQVEQAKGGTPRECGRGVMLISHLGVVSRLKMSGAVPPLFRMIACRTALPSPLPPRNAQKRKKSAEKLPLLYLM